VNRNGDAGTRCPFGIVEMVPVMSRSNQNHDCRVVGGATSIVPDGAPDWITAELVELTIRVWQPFYDEVVTPEEAVTMILNVGRLYGVLSSG